MPTKCGATLVNIPEGKSIEVKNNVLVKIFFAPDADFPYECRYAFVNYYVSIQ